MKQWILNFHTLLFFSCMYMLFLGSRNQDVICLVLIKAIKHIRWSCLFKHTIQFNLFKHIKWSSVFV